MECSAKKFIHCVTEYCISYCCIMGAEVNTVYYNNVFCSILLIISEFHHQQQRAKSPSQVEPAHPSSSPLSRSEHSTPTVAKKRKIVHEVLSPTPSNSSGVTVLEPLQNDAVDEMLAASH